MQVLPVPPDLARALAAYQCAAAKFDGFPHSVKRGILEWILAARKAETRAKRISETARLASQNPRDNQWRDKSAR